ncbi:DUF5677 domain-containing protein [Enterococcus dongliensis]|uniref:DUF5677 domain-containing protein n=1 Tax=Enterococcus dongliensis TaxID=2559925 RepID=UPI002891B67C|nr:DUF5677 domain-containing protein [Enterococcus dongliensis]MDT2646336.1 DUF5677 domain-containing protein [Enterococcus dongliensis]
MDFSKEVDPVEILERNKSSITLILEKITETSLGTEKDIVLIGLYNNLIQTTRETFILLKYKSTESIGAILRSQSEIFITLMYILKSREIEKTAEYFYNWSKFKNIQSAKKINYWEDNQIDETPYLEAEDKCKNYCLEYIEEHQNVSNFDLYRSNNWLGFDERTNSIRKIFKFVGYEKYYFILYSPMSSMSHGTGVVENVIRHGQNTIEFKSMIKPLTILRFQLEFLEDVREKMMKYYNISNVG